MENIFKYKLYNDKVKNDWFIFLLFPLVFYIVCMSSLIIYFSASLKYIIIGCLPLYLLIIASLPSMFSRHKYYSEISLDTENNLISIYSKKNNRNIYFDLMDIQYVNLVRTGTTAANSKYNGLTIYCENKRKFKLLMDKSDAHELNTRISDKIGDKPIKENMLLKIFYIIFSIIAITFIIFVILVINGLIF